MSAECALRFQLLDQRHGARWCPHLSLVDKVDENVARLDFRGRGFDAPEVGRRATADPSAQARGPICDCAFRIGGCNGNLSPLAAPITLGGGDIRHMRVGLSPPRYPRP